MNFAGAVNYNRRTPSRKHPMQNKVL